jgi:hypothetical protein
MSSVHGPNAFAAGTFRTIEGRMASLGIKLRDHIIDNPVTKADFQVYPLTLQGVDFTVKDPDKLIREIQNAKNGADKAFKQGSTRGADWQEHWAMTASLQATRGIGFREPWRFYLNDRGLQLENARPPRMRGDHTPEFDPGFAAPFGESTQLNMSALHVSIAYGKWTICNIHVDETGIAMESQDGDVSITPNAGTHSGNELIFKTFAGEHLPTWFIDRFNFHILSPDMNFNRIGASFDILKGKTYKLTLTASCGLSSCQDIDVTKLVKLDANAWKQLNPTLSFTKHW